MPTRGGNKAHIKEQPTYRRDRRTDMGIFGDQNVKNENDGFTTKQLHFCCLLNIPFKSMCYLISSLTRDHVTN
jgi:hypothetical protein